MFPSRMFLWMFVASFGLNGLLLLLILWLRRWFGGGESNLANVLSITRAFLAAPLAILVIGGHFGVALWVYVVCLASDLVDGAIARARGQQSQFGAAVDPLADIVTTAALYGALLVHGMLPLWVFLILMLRYVSLFVGIVAVFLSSIPLRIHATAVGKIVGVLQGTAGIMMLILADGGAQWTETIGVTLFPFLGIIFGSVIVSQLIMGIRVVRDGAKSAGS